MKDIEFEQFIIARHTPKKFKKGETITFPEIKKEIEKVAKEKTPYEKALLVNSKKNACVYKIYYNDKKEGVTVALLYMITDFIEEGKIR